MLTKQLFRALAAVLVLTGCHSNPATESGKSIRTVEHVVLIGPDGFSADVVRENPGKFPNLERLMREGSYTLHSRSVLPSSSAINWATVLMGAGSEMHGFTEWGSRTPEVVPVTTNKHGLFPGIFGEIREQKPEAVTGALYSWDGIAYLFERETVNLDFPTSTDDSIAMKAVEFITQQKPAFTFVYFAEPDGAGHGQGWSTPEYVAACEKIDSLTGIVLAAIDETFDPAKTAIIFTSDHGGIEKGHGGKTMNEMEAPFVIVGPGIPAGQEIERIVMKYDIAPTIADLLGIRSPDVWRGRSLFAY